MIYMRRKRMICLPLRMEAFACNHQERDSIPSSIVDEEGCCCKCWSEAVLCHIWIICISGIWRNALCAALILADDNVFKLKRPHGSQNLDLIIQENGYYFPIFNRERSPSFWSNTFSFLMSSASKLTGVSIANRASICRRWFCIMSRIIP